MARRLFRTITPSPPDGTPSAKWRTALGKRCVFLGKLETVRQFQLAAEGVAVAPDSLATNHWPQATDHSLQTACGSALGAIL